MRRLPPPMTAIDEAVMMLRTAEKSIGELEVRTKRRLSARYTKQERRRDLICLARAREVAANCREFLALQEMHRRAQARRRSHAPHPLRRAA